jgi:hypothetical protein
MTDNPDGKYSGQEAQQCFEKLVKIALKSPPKPIKSMGPKGVPARPRRRTPRLK